MKLLVSKVSLPNTYTESFDTVREAIEFMKRRVCSSCLSEEYNEYVKDLKIPPEGWTDYDYLRALLMTSCGLEYEMELADG